MTALKFSERTSLPQGCFHPASTGNIASLRVVRARRHLPKEVVMARRASRPAVSRRKFLASVAVASAATVAPTKAGSTAAVTSAHPVLPRKQPPVLPELELTALESGSPQEASLIGGVPGSDFMVDVIKTLEIKYLPSNPASSFRGLHESLINYGGNKMPEFLTAAHEGSAGPHRPSHF